MSAAWWLVVVGSPALAIALGLTRLEADRLRSVTLFLGALMLTFALLALGFPGLAEWRLPGPLPGGDLFRIDALSAPLPALAAGLWLFSVAVTPRMTLDKQGLSRAARTTLLTTLTFASESPFVLCVLWALSVLNLPGARRAPHRAGWYLWASALLLAGGVALRLLPATEGTWAATAGLAMIGGAAAIRAGLLPLHAWLPALFDHGPLGPSLLFAAPQVGTYVLAVLVVPHAPDEMLRTLAIIALATAVYASALAVAQSSARRACAYLFMSQSSLVVAGLDCTSQEALTGALVLWLASSLAFAGLSRCVLVLEARRGRQELTRHHGGYERKPLLAVSFLLLGLSSTGFPGTLGFVGEELLLGGAVSDFPVLGFLVVATGAFTGLAVLRMYFSLFTGVKGDGVKLDLRPREAVGFAAVVGVLLATGLVPAPTVRARGVAGAHLIELRRHR